MKVVAFLPAKGRSDRVPNKNMRIFNGEPFFCFTLKKLLSNKDIDEVYIDSEDDAILNIGRMLGAKTLKRDASLSSNDTDGHELFANEIRQVEADIYVQALCTSPFVKECTISKAINILELNSNHDSVVLMRKEKFYEWKDGYPSYQLHGIKIPNSVDLPDRHLEAMSLYVVRSRTAHALKGRIGYEPYLLYSDDPIESVDVNTSDDFKFAEVIANGLLGDQSNKHKILRSFLSSEMISDQCDVLGISGVPRGSFQCNLGMSKVLGRARTMKLRAMGTGDKEEDIYLSLDSYKTLVNNDVIVIEGSSEWAYFGELNAALAIRSGAQGVIIDGMTRDVRKTAELGLPVWARGITCQDVKGRMVMDSINKPITIDGINISPSHLIFADNDGVVVIPPEHEKRILGSSLDVAIKEKKILGDIASGIDVGSIISQYGEF